MMNKPTSLHLLVALFLILTLLGPRAQAQSVSGTWTQAGTGASSTWTSTAGGVGITVAASGYGSGLGFALNDFITNDLLETSSESGLINYSNPNTDSDGFFTAQDNYSDGDGCYDVSEALLADVDFDGQLGFTPVTVDANGVVTSALDGYSGMYSAVLDPTVFWSSGDNDGIVDYLDLDDDNDGIPDLDESCTTAFSVDGTGVWPGASSANYTITTSGLTIQPTATNWVVGSQFYLASTQRYNNLGSAAYDMTITFDQPVTAREIAFTTIDVDKSTFDLDISVAGGTATTVDFIGMDRGSGLSAQLPYDPSTGKLSLAGVPGTNLNYSRVVVGISDATLTSFTITLNAVSPSDFVAHTINAFTFCDTDGDGVIDIYDLDSDNDGIYDAVEAGHSQAITNGVVNGAVTASGIPIAVDADLNSIIDYSIIDSDGDSVADHMEFDSDGDGCNDVVEAGYADPNGDGRLGSIPLLVDPITGLVISGGP